MELDEKYDDGKIHENKQEVETIRVRISLRKLWEDKVKLNAFLRAFQRIMDKDPKDPNSFWMIAGYHGEPFAGDTWKNDPNSWGGYCQHANVLFPTWHRGYCLRLENALRSVMEPGDDVTLPYWDYTSKKSLSEGIPEILTTEWVTIDGKRTPNPLTSYEFQEVINGATGDEYYQKPKGYNTVRFPYSGIEGPKFNKGLSDAHNKVIDDILKSTGKSANDYLSCNLHDWMIGHKKGHPNNIYNKIAKCLKAANYTVFSNTKSAKSVVDTSLEGPHNDVHLAVGGFTKPSRAKSDVTLSFPHFWIKNFLILGANGDMGENETAAFDPCFFFHHCNVDRLFWIWQKTHNSTTTLDIADNSETAKGPVMNPSRKTASGPTAGQSYDEQLTLDTPLYPFKDANNNDLTSRMVIDIRNQCGYDYSIGSFYTDIVEHALVMQRSFDLTLEAEPVSALKNMITLLCNERGNASYVVHITGCDDEKVYNAKVGEGQEYEQGRVFREDFVKASGFNKAWFPGSFVVRAWYTPPGSQDKQLIGQEGILDRWDATNCANCQTRRMRDVHFSLADFGPIQHKNVTFEVVRRDMVNATQLVQEVTVDDPKGLQIQNIGFYCALTNHKMEQISAIDHRRPVAWEAQPAGG